MPQRGRKIDSSDSDEQTHQALHLHHGLIDSVQAPNIPDERNILTGLSSLEFKNDSEEGLSKLRVSNTEETDSASASATATTLSTTSPTHFGAAQEGHVDSHQAQVAIKILVSNNASGSIIGRSGKTISELQEKSHSRIKLSQGGDYYPGTIDRVCLIQGPLTNVNVAIELVLSKLTDTQSLLQTQQSKPGDLSKDQKLGEPTSFIVRLLIPSTCCGMLIGRGGSNIKMLKEHSGVSYIQLSQKENEMVMIGPTAVATAAIVASTSERIMTITGPDSTCCAKCVQRILSDMALNTEISRYINMTTSYSKMTTAAQSTFGSPAPLYTPRQEDMHESVNRLQIPESPARHSNDQHFISTMHMQQQYNSSSIMSSDTSHYDVLNHGNMVMPAIVGSSAIRPLQTYDHSMIASTPSNSGLLQEFHGQSPPSPVLLYSHCETTSVGHAIQLWPPDVSHNSMSQALPPTASGTLSPIDQLSHRFQLQTSLHSPPTIQQKSVPQPVTVQFGVPENLIGSILGRGGKTLTEIQATSQTRIRISQRGEYIPGSKQRVVTISGSTSQNVATAQTLINQRLSASALHSGTQNNTLA